MREGDGGEVGGTQPVAQTTERRDMDGRAKAASLASLRGPGPLKYSYLVSSFNTSTRGTSEPASDSLTD